MVRNPEKFEPKIEKEKEINYSQKGLKDLIIEKPIITEEDVFPYAIRIKAKNVETTKSAFYSAENSFAEKVKAKTAFWSAKNCQLKEFEGGDLFYAAINCVAEKVKATEAFDSAKNCRVTEFEGASAFHYAENCLAEKVKAKIAFDWATNCKANEVKGWNLFYNAKNCLAEKAKAEGGGFDFAKNCQVGEIEGKRLFDTAINCLAEKVKGKKIGRDSLGVVILGKAEGKIFPSVILMEGKVKEKPEEIKKFFEEELKKSQQGKESIYDYLSFFNWEGQTLKEGKEKLKKRYKRIKAKNELSKELRGYYFYFLIPDNSKREEILSGFKKLRKVEKTTLEMLNEYLPELEKVKDYLSTLSLKDWIKLAEYAEILSFDEKKIKEIEKSLDIKLDEVLKNPEKFDWLKTAKLIKNLIARGEKIEKKLLEKRLKKEIGDKKAHLIREYILNSPIENVKKYLKELGIEKEINKDIIFGARLHKVLEEKGEIENQKILEELLKGKKPIDWEENKKWLDKMEKKLNIKAWQSHYFKEYSPLVSREYQESLGRSQKAHQKEIIKHLREVGIEISPETKVREIEKILEENKEKISKELQRDIKTHLDAIIALMGIEESKLPQKIILETEEEPLKILQMGEKVIGSCLRIRGGHEESAVCNAVDINKKIIWAKDEKGSILGRVLIGITEEGKLAGFRIYNNDPRLDLQPIFKDFLSFLAKEIKTKLTLKGEIKELVGKHWYNDGFQEWEK